MKGNANDLGVEKLGRLLIQYSVPAIIATAAASLYNIIDRIFIGQGVGPLAISGLALTFPLMNITAAFGAMVGVGASAMVSIRLGQHDRKGATQILGNAVMLNLILGIGIGLITFIFLEPILYALGASKDTLPYAKEFMQVILLGNVFAHLYLGLNNIIRSSGYPGKAMIITLVTVAVNLILAPVFIFVFKWGIRGAALATVCAQFIGTITAIVHFTKIDSFVRFLPGYMRLKRAIIKDIISIGMSNFLMLIFGSVVISIFNLSLRKYGGDFAIGAFGILISFANLAVMVVIGFNQGMQPIVGYNYGAKQIPRVIRTFKLTVFAATCVTSFMFLIAMIFPRLIASAFTNNDELIGSCCHGDEAEPPAIPDCRISDCDIKFFPVNRKSEIFNFSFADTSGSLSHPGTVYYAAFSAAERSLAGRTRRRFCIDSSDIDCIEMATWKTDAGYPTLLATEVLTKVARRLLYK